MKSAQSSSAAIAIARMQIPLEIDANIGEIHVNVSENHRVQYFLSLMFSVAIVPEGIIYCSQSTV